MPNNPFDPSPQQSQTGQQDPDQTQGVPQDELHGRWLDWLDRPANRSALMQFGIAMLQPIQQGEGGFGGHFANAIGHGGQAAEAVQEQGRKQEETESKSQLRAMEADLAATRASVAPMLAEARANAAGSAADARRMGIAVQQERLAQQEQRMRSIADIAMSNQYGQEVQRINKRNADRQLGLDNTPMEEIPDFDTFRSSRTPGAGPGAAAGVPMSSGGGTKPTIGSLIKNNPAAWAKIQALPPELKARALDDLRNRVIDPDNVK